MKGYYKLRRKAFEILRTRLPRELYYHSFNHTLNVLKTCNYYIKREKVSKRNAKLLRLGVILHDIGFTISKVEHEERGKDLANELMRKIGFSQKDIRIVEGLILATRIPQSPKNDLERIICDCDLDYLGRSDFYRISDQLYKELKTGSMVRSKSDWNKIQIKFMQRHRYHTEFAIKYRQPEKEKRIEELRNLELKTANR
jgi:predicted metal-dependent HD superfamily phosphohydrolase